MLDGLRRRQTLASFDYQWTHMPDGDAMLSDPWFLANVHQILAGELLALDPSWFAGRTALDAGCGGGRWTLGLLRLGCRVTAVDASAGALDATRRQMERLAPDALHAGRLETRQVDLLDLPADLRERRFDLVFSFGVLHHTGDTRRALDGLAPLVGPAGVLFLYLYGRASVRGARRLALALMRSALAPLPFAAKRRALALAFPGRDVHQSFDLLSPLVNDVHPHAVVEGWLRGHGFPHVTRTLEHSELFLRAARSGGLPVLPLPAPPFWFERYRRR